MLHYITLSNTPPQANSVIVLPAQLKATTSLPQRNQSIMSTLGTTLNAQTRVSSTPQKRPHYAFFHLLLHPEILFTKPSFRGKYFNLYNPFQIHLCDKDNQGRTKIFFLYALIRIESNFAANNHNNVLQIIFPLSAHKYKYSPLPKL